MKTDFFNQWHVLSLTRGCLSQIMSDETVKNEKFSQHIYRKWTKFGQSKRLFQQYSSYRNCTRNNTLPSLNPSQRLRIKALVTDTFVIIDSIESYTTTVNLLIKLIKTVTHQILTANFTFRLLRAVLAIYKHCRYQKCLNSKIWLKTIVYPY